MNKILEKVKIQKSEYKYKEARDLIEKEEALNPELSRELAECYYKDLELHRDESFPIAINLLKNMDLAKDDNPSETLCLLGAIYKRKWEYERDLDELYLSIDKYKLSYEKYHTNEMYYGAINASFLYDVLANEFKEQDYIYAQSLQSKAIEIRKNIINEYDKDLKDRDDALWIKNTLAQAYLGIDDIENCKKKLQEANEIKSDDWKNYTSYKHLKKLADLRDIKEQSFLNILLSNDYCASLDKKGLALSGGGFRASFFHLGTLAKLAECDLLGDIEVISTVSGGSIVGVHYYLKLQKLLENKSDLEITQNDYINLVHELIDEFFEAVQTDIRNSVITKDFFTNTLTKILNPLCSYSRTNKLGELYQERIYKKYKKYMSDLIITPFEYKGKKDVFKPRFNNWRRKNKVPILVINATNLNSGHNWQFQATKMGEPDYMSDMEIDKNSRFEWVRYDAKGLQNKFEKYPIGQAVACSSAVPMLFTPIVLEDLYEGYKLSISDGGVYDNQGFSGLLSEECDYIICSDASGQMDNQVSSHTSILRTNMRVIDIQMDRNRELVFEEMNKRFDQGMLKGFYFAHLKQNFKSYEINQAQVIQESEDNSDKEFQKLISGVRTDLDIFSKTEAYALMYNGYDLFQKQIEATKHIKTVVQCNKKEDWVFLSIKNDVDKQSKKLMDELALSEYKFGRRFRKWWRSR
ncbi:MAG: patatin-like phospholipase family protein [Sulfurimonas sp.]|jgi:predicted acylesterase/phospholipase RssA